MHRDNVIDSLILTPKLQQNTAVLLPDGLLLLLLL
jgi:hypothetical protein